MAGVSMRIGRRLLGPAHPVYCVAEIGINHNGDLGLARDLVKAAAFAGCDAVKMQKRRIDAVYTSEQLARPRESPFGSTNRALKEALELSLEAWAELKSLAEHLGMDLYASCWDVGSVDDLSGLKPSAYKVASPCLTNDDLLDAIRRQGTPVVMSIGMSTLDEIEHAVGRLGRKDLLLMHCVSVYPTPVQEINLAAIPALQERYPDVLVGYSGHESGFLPSLAAVALGACMVERHLTLSRELWGSDHCSSLEPNEMRAMVEGVRTIASARGDGKPGLRLCELPAREHLRFRR